MPNHLRVPSRVRGPETEAHRAEREARVDEIVGHVRHHQRAAARLMAAAKRKLKWVKPTLKSR
jgi:hypothetical protein